MRRTFVSFIIILFFVALFICYVLYTPFLLSALIPRFIESQYPAVELQSFSIRRQAFRFPDAIKLYQVHFTVKYKDVLYECKFAQVAFKDILKPKKGQYKVKMRADGGDVKWDKGYFKKVQFNTQVAYKNKTFNSINGILGVNEINIGGYDLSGFSARFRQEGNHLEIFEIAFNGYGGKGQGQISIDNILSPSYVVWLEFIDLEPKELEKINSKFFSQLRGVMNGNIRVVGIPGSLDLFAMSLAFSEGGVLKSSLVKRIADKIRDGVQQERLRTLIQSRKELSIENGSLHFNKSKNSHLLFSYSINGKDLDLPFKEIIDLGTDVEFKVFLGMSE